MIKSARIRHIVPVLLTLTLLALNGCTPRETPQLRVGLNSWPGYEPIYLAQERGFYREAGLDVRVVEFNSLSDARRAFERGQIDILATTVIEVLEVREQSNRTPQIVQIVDYSNGADLILAHPPIADIAALAGARVGVELGSVGLYILVRALELSSMSPADVDLVPSDQLSMASDFVAGELDAVVTYPPLSISLQRDHTAHAIFSSASIPGEVLDVIAVDAELIRTHPNAVKGFLRAFRRAVEYATAEPEQAYRMMAEREGISAAEFAAVLDNGLIRLVTASEQREYFQSDGKLHQAIYSAYRVLHLNAPVDIGPDPRRLIINADFIDMDSAHD